MRFKKIKLVGYAGFMHGMLKKEISIDFTKCKSNIIMIMGPNGSGKTTLKEALTIYPNDNSMFLPGEYGEQSGIVEDGAFEYDFRIEHPVKTVNTEEGPKVVRDTTKAYIKKKTPEGWMELNPNGTVGTYKDIICAEFNLDPNFESLASLSTEDQGIVNRTPAERKKLVGSITDKIEVYNSINKTLTKRNAINKSMMNNILSKIESTGDEETLSTTLTSVLQRIENLKVNRDGLISKVAEFESTIKLLDPDSSIQNLYTTIQVELARVDSEITKLDNVSRTLLTNLDLEALNFDLLISKKEEITKKMFQIESSITEIDNSIKNLISSREEEARAIQLKVQRLDSLRSEMDYVDLENTIKILKENIVKYEKIFEDIHIKNAISISKDEYITGLNTMMDIKNMIDSVYSANENYIIEECIKYIDSNTDLLSHRETIEKKLNDAKATVERLSMDYTMHCAMAETVSLLTKRPKSCKEDTCPFISEALKLSNMPESPEKLAGMDADMIAKLKEDITKYEEIIKNIDTSIYVVKDIKIILRTVDNNKNILKKLPGCEAFLNTKKFLGRIYSRDRFNEIEEMYQYINYANIFEEYKLAKDNLYKLEVDFEIYKSKNEVIVELEKDVDTLQNKLNGIMITITESNNKIASLKSEYEDIKKFLIDLDTLIDIHNKSKDLKLQQADFLSRLNAISSNMDKIKINLSEKEKALDSLRMIDNELRPLENDRDSLKFALTNYKQYKKDYDALSKSYNVIEVIKKFSTPTKDGIQNIFIKVYMGQTIKLANEILALFFGGDLVLQPYVINETDFRIPCYSNYCNLAVDDISALSRSQKAMSSLAISTALLQQASTKYNIFRLDEIDEGLDSKNRIGWINVVLAIIQRLNIEQCIMVSHSTELSLGQVDIIKLGNEDNRVVGEEGNVIYEAF